MATSGVPRSAWHGISAMCTKPVVKSICSRRKFDELRDAQSVPVGEEDERPVARTVAAHLLEASRDLFDLHRREILGGVG